MNTTKCSKKPGEPCRLHNPAPTGPIGLLSQKDFFEPPVVDPAQSLLNEFLLASKVDFGGLKKWFLCDSRLSGDKLKLIMETHNPNLVVKTCHYCGHPHQAPRDEVYDEAYWTPKMQFSLLEKYARALKNGQVVGRAAESLPCFEHPNPEADILLRGAKAYYDDIKMSRSELLTWYQCERKFSFSDLPSANKEAARLSAHKGKCESYKCPFCSSYHIGRPDTHAKKSTANSGRLVYKHAYLTYLDYIEKGKPLRKNSL